MRGLYAHASDRMRDDLKAALQARWEDSLRARAAIHGCSPVPLLDELLNPFRDEGHQHDDPASPVTDKTAATTTGQGRPEPGGREKMISQIPPKYSKDPTQPARVRPVRRASDLVRHHDQRVELRGFEPLTPSMRTRCATGLRYSPKGTAVSVANLAARSRRRQAPRRPRRPLRRQGCPARRSSTSRAGSATSSTTSTPTPRCGPSAIDGQPHPLGLCAALADGASGRPGLLR